MPQSVPYPTTLLTPPTFSFAPDQEAATIRTNTTTGLAVQRRIKTRGRVLVNVTWMFDAREILLFRSWFNDELGAGVGWFSIPLKLGHITRTFEMRFTGGFSQSHKAVNNWEVSAQLEIYDMQDCAYGEIEAAILYYWEHPTLPEFGGGFDARMEAIELNVSTVLDATHSHKFMRANSSLNLQFILPKDAGFTNEWFTIVSRVGTGAVSFTGESDVIIDSELNMRSIDGQNTVVVIHYVSNNRHHIYGSLKS